jgi:hypothetical protein
MESQKSGLTHTEDLDGILRHFKSLLIGKTTDRMGAWI